MGSYSWVRDDKRTGGGKSVVTGVAAVIPQQPTTKKRKLVWQRGDASQPAQLSGGTEPNEGSNAKPPNDPNTSSDPSRPDEAPNQPVSSSQQPSSAKAAIAAKQKELQAKREALEALQKEIESKKRALDESAAASKRAKMDVIEKQKQEEQQRLDRRKKLEAAVINAFTEAFAEAKKAADAEIAASRQPISFADEAEVERVLSAPSDYAVLKLQPGAEAAAVRKRYREMAVTLHPDKCTTPKAAEAFHRLVTAYQQLQKYAK